MPLIFVNGKKTAHDALCISPFDRGLTLGHGLFETMMINDGCIPLINYHWERLVASANLININLPFSYSDLKHMVNELIEDNSLSSSNGVVRLTLTDGIAPRGILSSGSQPSTYIICTFPGSGFSTTPLTGTIVTTRKNEYSLASQVKSTSYLDLILAKQEAVSRGFDEAILLNTKSTLAEGAVTNIFVVKNGEIFTPPITDGALPGVTRRVILNDLEIDGISMHELTISTDFLMQADEVFLTNSLLGIRPLKKLDQKNFDPNCPLTNKILQKYHRFIEDKTLEYLQTTYPKLN